MLAQALPIGQLWLCFPREENCTNIDPGAKPARGGSKMVSGRPPDGSIGPNFAARAVRKPCLGGSGGALGALLAARGAVLKPLGPLLGRPGPLLGALGGGFGTSQGLIWTIWTMSVALREIQQKPLFYCVFWLPEPPGEVRNRSKIGPGGLLDVSWDQRTVWRAQVEVHKGQVELHKAVLDPM